MFINACSIFHDEIAKVIALENITGIKITGKKANCGQRNTDLHCYRTDEDNVNNEVCVFIGKDCVENKCGYCNFRTNNHKYETQCYAILVQEEIINYYIEKGYYLVSPGWLKDWKYYVVELWQFNEQTAKLFFSDSASKIVLFDTGIYSNSKVQLTEFATFVGLDYEIIPVGLNYLKSKLNSALQSYLFKNKEHELQQTKAEINKQQANNLLVFDFLKKLNDFNSEEELIHFALNLFNILFSPAKLAYYSIEQDNNYKTTCFIPFENTGKYHSQFNFDENYTITNLRKGIITKVSYKSQLFGYVVLDELLFPENISKYIPIINLIANSMGVIVSNISKTTEILKAKAKAEESDRLKTAFLQNMSHEIRTPLNAISGFSSMLNKSDLPEEKRKSFISIIQNSSKQLISIVSDILTISSLETKQEKINISGVCINNIIVELLAIFKQQAISQNISLYATQQLTDEQSEIFTDKTKITQILSNLISNALKFTAEGFIEFGYIYVEKYGRTSLPELQFYVKDTGIGIKPEFHEKIFERFRQADKSINKLYGGTGLGLAISKAFATLLGGKIWVESEPEKGSAFYFTIPYKPVHQINKIISPTIQTENYKTIIVAEDEEFNFLFIEELLMDISAKLIHAKNGQEAVDIVKTNPNINLILMDIKMPVLTGDEAAKIIKSIKPDLPIIAQSAYALEHERAKFEGIFDDYIIKPIKENDIIPKISKYIEF